MNLDIPQEPASTSLKKKFLLDVDKENNYILQIDNSSLENYTCCPRSFEISNLLGKVGRESAALVAGGALHAGLEELYKAELFDFGMTPARRAVLNAFSPHSVDLNEWRTPEFVLDVLERYASHYEEETFSVCKDISGKPLVEQSFSIPLCTIEINDTLPYEFSYLTGKEGDHEIYISNLHVYWTGKIDLVISENNSLWLLDHKTTSILGDSYWLDFELSQQTIGYTWALWKMLESLPKGFIANVIAWRKPTRTGVSIEFVRKRYYYPEWKLLEWENNTKAIVSRLIEDLREGMFPAHRKWCVGKYGKCVYHDACNMDLQARSMYLNSSDFRDNTWSPLNH